jgi:hypothetical protein
MPRIDRTDIHEGYDVVIVINGTGGGLPGGDGAKNAWCIQLHSPRYLSATVYAIDENYRLLFYLESIVRLIDHFQ